MIAMMYRKKLSLNKKQYFVFDYLINTLLVYINVSCDIEMYVCLEKNREDATVIQKGLVNFNPPLIYLFLTRINQQNIE